jgi:hypothetical protein
VQLDRVSRKEIASVYYRKIATPVSTYISFSYYRLLHMTTLTAANTSSGEEAYGGGDDDNGGDDAGNDENDSDDVQDERSSAGRLYH